MNDIVKTDQASDVQTVLSGIMRAASDPAVDVEKLRALLDMQKEIMEHQAKMQFNESMNSAQLEILPIIRDKQNSHTKSKYARLETLDDGIRPVYTKHGFSLSFGSEACDDGAVNVTCTVAHTGGYTREYSLKGNLDTAGPEGKTNKTSIQGLGSTVSYLRRYLCMMIFNVVMKDEDNDGNRMGEKFITPSQGEALLSALGGIGERHDVFCKKYGLNHLGELAASDFDKAMAIIKRENDK